MRTKIVFIITNSDRAGAQKHVKSLVTYFSRSFDVELISGSTGFLSEWSTSKGVRTTIIPELGRNISLLNDIRAALHIRKILKEVDPDLVHLHSAKAGFVGRIACIGIRTKVLYTVHGWAFSEGNRRSKRWLSLFLEKIISSLADKFILVSHYDLRLAQKYNIARIQKMIVVHNGIPDVSTICSRKVGANICRAASLVRFARQKNIPCMLHAVHKSTVDFSLRIAGIGPLRDDIEDLLNRLNLNEQVKLVGEVEDISEFLRDSNVFVLSSDWEGLPIALIEACREGLAIISTDVGGINEIVENGENGYLVPRARPDMLAKAFDCLMADEEEIIKMGERSREIYIERFSEVDMLEKTHEVYNELLTA